MKIQCVNCGKLKKVHLDKEVYEDWVKGNISILQIAPHLPQQDIDLITTKICTNCWEKQLERPNNEQLHGMDEYTNQKNPK